MALLASLVHVNDGRGPLGAAVVAGPRNHSWAETKQQSEYSDDNYAHGDEGGYPDGYSDATGGHDNKGGCSREDGYSKDEWCAVEASDPIYGDILDFLIERPHSSTDDAMSSGWTASPTTSSTRACPQNRLPAQRRWLRWAQLALDDTDNRSPTS